jgi:hypothetical protein
MSDLANVNVAYFDDQVPTFMNFTTISPGRAFIGRLDARNESTYSPAGRPGVIMFWSDDIYDPNYRPVVRPAAFNPATDAIQFVPPLMDVIEYFTPPGPLAPQREDRMFEFQNYPVVLQRFYLVLPYYGRKYASVNFTNKDALLPNTFGIVGLNYAITQDDQPNAYHQETTIVAPTAVAAGASLNKQITSAVDGTFDALVFNLTLAGPAPLRVTMSDIPPGGP